MTRTTMLVLILSSLIFNEVVAQTAYSWQPDTAQIFAAGVEIVSVTSSELPPEARLDRKPVADNQRRVIQVYDAEADIWHEYAYPADIHHMVGRPVEWKGKLLLAAAVSADSVGWIVWELNVESGEFQTFRPCLGTTVQNYLLTDPQWVFVTQDGTGIDYLCDIETGDLHGPLPGETTDWSGLRVSPNGSYLVLRGAGAEYADRGGPNDFYGYDIATRKFSVLGSLSSMVMDSDFEDWLDDTHMLYRLVDYDEGNYYVMDVTQPDSIETVITTWAEFHPQVRRYEFLRTHALLSRGADLHEHFPCTLEIFDLTTIAFRRYPLGYNCGGVYALDDYRYFYLTFDADPTVPSSLNVLDIRSDTQTTILQGEIEALESVSPDGRYVAIITDDNGVIDRGAIRDTQFFSWSQTLHPMVSLVDAERGHIIYQLPFDGWLRNRDFLYEVVTHSTYEIGIPQVGVVWLDNTRCLVQRSSDAAQEWEHHLLQFAGAEVTETPLGGYTRLILPNPHYLVTSQSSESGSQTYHLYEVGIGWKRPLFYNPFPDFYEYRMSVDENGMVVLSIQLHDGVNFANPKWVQYLLNIQG